MELVWQTKAWEDYLYWQHADKKSFAPDKRFDQRQFTNTF